MSFVVRIGVAAAVVVSVSWSLLAQTPDFSRKPPVLAVSPEEQAKRFWLPPGFQMTPVLTEPAIEEPAQIAFDGNGRLYVLEVRGYMQDLDATNQVAPVGRISVHEDANNDGRYERHHVFVDHLAFPRFVTPFGPNAILTKESNADEVWKFTDTNGDLIADKKELFATGLGRLLNVEHQESGFVWALDNWIYSTVNAARIRWTPHGVLREPTGSNQAQWGVTQDNYGKPWFQDGGSGMPGYFQFPVVYGNFSYPDQFEPNLSTTWGAPVFVADMQGGMGVVRQPDGSLTRATAGAGNDIFRGDRLPRDLIGDYFYGEVVARSVRRLRPVKDEGLTQLKNVYPLQEFIRSTDPLFRPVDVTTAPDGTMYITDMYRGVIQEREWSGPGTYIRRRIEQYALDKVIRRGRIWRITYEGMPRRTSPPRLLAQSAAQLVAHLADRNGWWRDTAQQLLVLKQDKTVVPRLRAMVKSPTNQLARIHALWTLEGLGAADAALVRSLMADRDEQIRIQTIRVSETLYKAGDRSFVDDWKRLTQDQHGEVVIQALLTLNTLRIPDVAEIAEKVFDSAKSKGIRLVAGAIANPPPTPGGATTASIREGSSAYTAEEIAAIERGAEVYRELCFACHGQDGLGAPTGEGRTATRAPGLAGSPRLLGHKDYVINTLLFGLTGRLNGVEYSDVMVPMGQNTDDWIAATASYVRNAFGNRAPVVTARDVAAVRRAQAARKTMWVVDELIASLPRQLPPDPGWKVSASHNAAAAGNALTIQPWTSGEPQTPGMSLQVELPQPTLITEIEFEAGRISDSAAPVGYPRAFDVTTSIDGVTWTPVASERGEGAVTNVRFEPLRAKFVRMALTAGGPDLPPWSVQRLRLFAPGVSAGGNRN